MTEDPSVSPQLKSLFGKPAPELNHIAEWKNGDPVKLADLRGHFVILDFWGYWCGPCIGAMPSLMDLHARYADEGVTIIAVHDPSVSSIAEIDRLLADAKVKERLWGGRDLPFLVALDGGQTTRMYGIESFPTTLLINREGILVGKIGTLNDWRRLDELMGFEDASLSVTITQNYWNNSLRGKYEPLLKREDNVPVIEASSPSGGYKHYLYSYAERGGLEKNVPDEEFRTTIPFGTYKIYFAIYNKKTRDLQDRLLLFSEVKVGSGEQKRLVVQ